MINRLFFGLLLFVYLAYAPIVLAQVDLFTNPSLEGEQGASRPPHSWTACNAGSTPDTQPGAFEVITRPSQGYSYLGIVCREDKTMEGISQQLLLPLEAGSCYPLTVDLARSLTYQGYNQPALLRMYGGSALGDKKELLWTSPVIRHTEWKTYTLTLSPKQRHTHFTMEVHYEGNIPYRGNVLIDNFSPAQIISLPTVALRSDTVVCDGESVLLALSLPDYASAYWTDGQGKALGKSNTLTITEEGTYQVAVSSACNSVQFQIQVHYQECPERFFVPNVITPNDDHYNDSFQIRNLSRDGWKLEVYSRWGELLFRKENYHEDWSAEGLAAGNYFFLLSKPGVKSFKGWVQVLK